MLLTRGDVAVPFPKYLQNELEAREETSDQQGSRVVLGHLDSRGRRVRSRRSGLRSSGRGNLPASSRRSCSQSGGHRRAAGGRSRRSRSSIAGGVLGTALGLLLALVLAVQVVGVVLNALAEVGLADKVGQRLGVLSRVGDRAVRADTREAQRVLKLVERCQPVAHDLPGSTVCNCINQLSITQGFQGNIPDRMCSR